MECIKTLMISLSDLMQVLPPFRLSLIKTIEEHEKLITFQLKSSIDLVLTQLH